MQSPATMTTRLVLLAHAPVPANRKTAFPLDGEAIESDLATAPSLGRLDHCFVAPELRAIETAALCGLAAETLETLRDLDAAAWRGQSFERLLESHPDEIAAWMSDPSARPGGGESVLDLVERVRPWLDRQQVGGGRIGAVTHPSVIRAMIVTALRMPAQLFWGIDVGPLALVTLGSDGRRWTLRSLVPWRK